MPTDFRLKLEWHLGSLMGGKSLLESLMKIATAVELASVVSGADSLWRMVGL